MYLYLYGLITRSLPLDHDLYPSPSAAGFKWVCLSLVMCFCSVLSKEQGITAIAVCLTYDVFIARNVSHHNSLAYTNTICMYMLVCQDKVTLV